MTEARGPVEYQKHRTIDGEEYKIHVMTPSTSIKLLTRIFKLLGEPFAEMAVGVKAAKNEDEANEQAMKLLPVAVRALVSRMDENEVMGVVQQLTSAVTVDNKQISFERHFQGRLGHLLKLLSACVEVQYGDFLGALAEMMSGTQAGA